MLRTIIFMMNHHRPIQTNKKTIFSKPTCKTLRIRMHPELRFTNEWLILQRQFALSIKAGYSRALVNYARCFDFSTKRISVTV